jgi:intracellular septation protein
MTEQSKTPRGPAANQLLIDLGPTILFVVTYNVLLHVASTKDNAVYIATELFIAATLLVMAYTFWKTRRIPPVLIVTGVLITIFGGLTIALHDANFVKLRPTISNFFYAGAITVSVLIRQNVWKLFFGHIFTLPDRIWNLLALRWAAFFFCMGLVAEGLRRGLSTSDWVTWHFPILYIPLLAFAVLQTPLILKHDSSDAPASEAPPA